MTQKTLALATLVEDLTLYPRNRIDDTWVSDLMRAIQAGAELPPIVADRRSLRIADGIHRRRALMRQLGDAATAPVILKDYENDTAFFLDAVALNAQHGRKLDRQDQTRIVLKLQELHVDERTIALTLHVPEPEVRTLALRVVYDQAGTPSPSKRGLEHLRGRKVTPLQLETIRTVRSGEAGRLSLELIRLLEADLVDLGDAQIVKRLRELNELIRKTLKSIAA